MSNDWTEETIKPYLFKEVEVRDSPAHKWRARKLSGFMMGKEFAFIVEALANESLTNGEFTAYRFMKPIPEPEWQPLESDDYHGEPLRFSSGKLEGPYNWEYYNVKGIKTLNFPAIFTWRELMKDGWEYFHQGEWKRMRKESK